MRGRTWVPALLALVLAGCACMNPANTPLLTALDEQVKPESAGAKIALGVVFVPVGMACGVADIAVVHPLHALVYAAEDARTAVWNGPQGAFIEQSLLFAPKLAVTPVVFSVAWVGESLFDIRPKKTGTAQ